MGHEVSQQTVDSAAVFLFNLFITEPQLTRSQAEEIRRTLGPFPASAATKALNIVKNIAVYLPKDSNLLNSHEEQVSLERSQNGSQKAEISQTRKEFGSNIVFKYEPEFVADLQHHMDNDSFVKSKHTLDYDSLSDDEAVKDGSSLSNIVTKTILETRPPPPIRTDPVQSRSNDGHSRSVVSFPYSGEWLKDKCRECVKESIIGLTWKDIHSVVFDMLCSSNDNGAIQNGVRHAHIHTCILVARLNLSSIVSSLQSYWVSLSLTSFRSY